MLETEIEELKRGSMAMFLGLDSLYKLHAEVELEGNDGTIEACAHCSMLADGVIAYPCPSVQILLTDFNELIIASESAESEEPSA